MVLTAAGACAVALFVVLFRLPGGGAIEQAAAVSNALAERLAAPPVGRAAAEAEMQRRLDLLDHALQADELDRVMATEFRARWQAAASSGVVTELRELLPAAHSLTTSVRAELDARHARLEGTIKAVTATLAVLLVVMVAGLLRHRRRLRRSLRRFSDDLGQGDWEDAVKALRDDPAGPPSAFDALASGVAGVLRESDRRWQSLAELSADWYWETDRQHRLTRVTGSLDVFTSMGWKAEDLLNRRFDQIGFMKAPGGTTWAPLVSSLQGEELFREFECSVIARDRRSMSWVALSGRPRQDEAGQFLGFEGVARDVTERRKTVAKLKASEQRWSTVVRLATDWYWESDEQHRLQPMAVDEQPEGRLFADAVRGHTLWEAFPEGLDSIGWEEHRQDLAAQQPFRELQLCIDTPDGSRQWLAISGMPRFNASGGFRGYHGVARDISAHKEAERVLLRHNEELQRAVTARTHELQAMNRDLEAFARQLAHELRTPVGHIQGLAQLLLQRTDNKLEPEERQIIELQIGAAGNMRESVDALLTLARSTMQPMSVEPLDLSALAHEAIESLTPIPRTAPVCWTIQPGLQAMAAPAALKIVLANLLGNAAKFTRRTAEPAVELSGRTDEDGTLHVVIDDNGIGFDPDKAERLFKPFGRLHTGDEYHGTGIGLTIVQRIVERHGGTVKAEARADGGARFEFTLPARTA